MSAYRKTVWFIKGMREYTKSGYEHAAKKFNTADLEVSCKDKAFMITGANSGIGKVTALEIAKRGGTVHLVCRSKERGEEALREIKEKSGNEEVFLHLLDMSRAGDVANFAKEFSESGKPLSCLVNNAGCMVNQRELTEDGLEKNFATNTLAVHILTSGLVELLQKSPQPRVITVTSGGMLVSSLNTDDLNFEKVRNFDGTMAYSENKRQQVVMTAVYAKRWPGVHFSTMHPGWADTPAVRTSMPDFYEKMKNKLRTAEQGADTLVWLCVSEAAQSQPSGLFFQDRVAVSAHLPLARTKPSQSDQDLLMTKLDELQVRFAPKSNI